MPTQNYQPRINNRLSSHNRFPAVFGILNFHCFSHREYDSLPKFLKQERVQFLTDFFQLSPLGASSPQVGIIQPLSTLFFCISTNFTLGCYFHLREMAFLSDKISYLHCLGRKLPLDKRDLIRSSNLLAPAPGLRSVVSPTTEQGSVPFSPVPTHHPPGTTIP